MRSLRHENLVEFIGICIENKQTMILMAHGQKGSLHDVLHNDRVKLSNDFRLSFAIDIAQVITCMLVY